MGLGWGVRGSEKQRPGEDARLGAVTCNICGWVGDCSWQTGLSRLELREQGLEMDRWQLRDMLPFGERCSRF